MITTIPKILLVDDELDAEDLFRQRFRRKIRQGELEFFYAPNGLVALELLSNNPEIDVVVTDINMPEMDGLTLLRKVKEQSLPARIIVMSAYGDMGNIRAAMNSGAFDFITKPVDFNDLDLTLNKTLEEVSLIKEGMLAKNQLVGAEEARERAEQSRKFKEQFLANMSHEIRTPMNAVVGMTNLLLKTDPSTQQLKYLKAIKQSADNLIVIINDILDISKIEAGRLEFEAVDFSLAEAIDGVANTIMFKSDEKGLYLNINIEEGIPPVLIGDPVRLNQILLNLASNAVKFTESGGITINVTQGETVNGKINIKFNVVDTGIGIPEDRLDAIFESFSQADSTTTRKFGGTGLGLTISKQLVELQGGHIGVSSIVGQGTTFYFELAFAPGNAQEAHASHLKPEGFSGKGVKILLAEDNAFNQIVAQDTLEGMFEGIKVDVVENGKLAIEQLTREHYDLILMDLNMPIMNGLEATRAIRKLDSDKKHTLIMAMTASATQEAIQECIDAGMNDYISKPFVPDELEEKITALLVSAAKNNKTEVAPKPAEQKELHILVVDDNDFNQMVAQDTLSTLFPHAKIDEALNGQIACDKIAAGNYSLILMDINMPVMGGHEATQFIRNKMAAPKNATPIMAMTANVEKFEVDKCLESGMNDYISKPFDPEVLKEKIHKLTNIAQLA
jgi:CheY-like chemotaxis protein